MISGPVALRILLHSPHSSGRWGVDDARHAIWICQRSRGESAMSVLHELQEPEERLLPATLAATPSPAEAAQPFRIALVAMPFLATYAPSIQLGLLTAIGAERGFDVSSLHLNLDFARAIGNAQYNALCACGPNRLGEWLFAPAAFGDAAPDPLDLLLGEIDPVYADELSKDGLDAERLLHIRRVEAPAYIERLLDAVDWAAYQVVGFTSSFEQNAASFALATRLKARFPSLTTVFGGANFDGDMGIEWVRSIDSIDYAVIGEADAAFPELLHCLRTGTDPAHVAGVVCRRGGAVTPLKTGALKFKLDESPVPDYREYFERLDALDFLTRVERREIRVPFESARGCWWGAKHHCTFCGLNGSSMAYRSKSATKVIDELQILSRRHHSFNFFAVDNILDPVYLKTFFTQLTDNGSDYEFFYEIKSNLTRAQLRTLHEGGVRQMQPGIESLSTPVLKLMRKGVTGIQNVNLMRWARYYNIRVGWNLLYGFPHETSAHYAEQCQLMRKLHHLEPPNTRATRIAMQRFSPIFSDRANFPALYTRPSKNYAQVYPAHVRLEHAVYYFDYELENTLDEADFEKTQDTVFAWKAAWDADRRPRMEFRHSPDFVQIEDRRDPLRPKSYSIEGTRAQLYVACSDEPHTPLGLQRLLNLDWSCERIQSALDAFEALGLSMREDHRYLSLALPASRWR